jgi:HAD superfamily phosphoserine phosphatase-like hydrolase
LSSHALAGTGFPREDVPPGVVFVDFDGTLISRSSEKLFLRHLLRTGLVSPSALIRFLAGYLLHPARTAREGKGWNRAYLRGLSEGEICTLAESFSRESLSGLLRPWTVQAVRDLSGRGWRVVLMSASLEMLASSMTRGMPFHGVVASRPQAVGGSLTGRLDGLRPWGIAKVELARRCCSEEGVDPASCLAIGDSWSDRHLMLFCGRGVAVCPDRKLVRLAAERGWDIVEGRHAAWA